MNRITIIGSVAAICTTIAFLPQVLRIRRTRHTADLSLPMYVIFCFGVFMWMCYGMMLNSVPIILANGITFILCLYILAMKIKHG